MLGTDTNLHGMRRVNQSLIRGVIEHSAVVKLAAVAVSVGMGIEMHQRHLTEMFGVCTQQRQRHKVIAPERETFFTGRQHFFCVRL